MSYDVYFVRREPGESFDDAMERLEKSAESPAAARDPRLPVAWGEIRTDLTERLGPLDEATEDGWSELTHVSSGLQLGWDGDEIALTVPYWYEGQDAVDIATVVADVVTVVQTRTGREAYDPQTGGPFSVDDVAPVMTDVHGRMSEITSSQEPPASTGLWQAAKPVPSRGRYLMYLVFGALTLVLGLLVLVFGGSRFFGVAATAIGALDLAIAWRIRRRLD